MATVRRNGFNRDMSCHWTVGSQNVDNIAGILEGLQNAASAVLACSDRGSQTKAQTQPPIPASIRSARPTLSSPSSRTTSNIAGKPSIQPLASARFPSSQAPKTSKPPPPQATPPLAVQTAKSNTTTLYMSVISTQSTRTTLITLTTSLPPTRLIPIPNSPESSSLAISASVPFASLMASELSSKQTHSLPTGSTPTLLAISIGDSSSEPGSSSSPLSNSNRTVSSRAGFIIGGVITGVILVAFLLTLYFCRRTKRKQHRRLLGYMSTAPLFEPWKKKEVERRNTVANLEAFLGERKREGEQVKPMRDRTVDFPASASVPVFAYEGKGTAPVSPRPLTMPEPLFAPLRANRSSSLYSGSLLNGFGFSAENFPPRASSALLLPTRAGWQDGDGIVMNPFLTPSELLKQKNKDMQTQVAIQGSRKKTSPPRSDIYISRPYSVFDIADDELKGRGRDSAISGLTKFEDLPPLSPSPLSFRSQSRSMPRSEPSTPSLSTSRSKSPSPSQFSRVSNYATSPITKKERALVTVKDLDTDVRLSLDVEQEYGYRICEFDVRGVDFDSRRGIGTGEMDMIGSKPKNEVVMIVSEREVSVGSGGGLEEWEKREMARSRKESEKARLYKGQIKPGMGVQKRGGGALGVERRPGGWEVGVQKRWTGLES